MNKRVILGVIFLFFWIAQGFPQEIVKVRLNRNPNFVRVVLEGSAAFISKANIRVQERELIVEFPGNIVIAGDIQNANIKDNLFRLPLEGLIQGDVDNVKSFLLKEPPRLVVDIAFSQKLPIKRIVLDAGHGGYDAGVEFEGAKEKDITLEIVKHLKASLSASGVTVYLTRAGDQPMGIKDRIEFAKSKTPDLFLSLHLSQRKNFIVYATTSDNRGGRTASEKNRALQDAIKSALKASFKEEVDTRIVPIYLLQSVNEPSVMIELPSVRYDEKLKKRISEAITDGIRKFVSKQKE